MVKSTSSAAKRYGVLVLDTETGKYKVHSVETGRYAAAKVAQRLREDLQDPFDGLGQDMVVIAPRAVKSGV